MVKEITAGSKLDSSEGWEQVPRAADIQEESMEDSTAEELVDTGSGTTGREGDDDGGLTKRVTRSTKKKDSLEALE